MPVQSTAASYWDAHSARGYAPNWYSFCAAEIKRRITGDPELSPTLWALRRHFGSFPIDHMLEIGCLDGRKLAGLVDHGVALHGTGIDVAAQAIAAGQAKWQDKVSLHVIDLNTADRLPGEPFNAVVANGVLHHIARIEHCLRVVYRSMAIGGVLVASEFTGPQRYQYSAEEIDVINAGMAMLPQELHGARFDPRQLAPKLDVDPSEAVNTWSIYPTLQAVFDDVECFPYGGNVLMRALTAKFFKDFQPGNPAHTAAVERLVAFDAEISARMGAHHHLFVAKRTNG